MFNFITSGSPPKPITLDEVMASAQDLSNLSLAHEIVVNQKFHLEPPELPQHRYQIISNLIFSAFTKK